MQMVPVRVPKATISNAPQQSFINNIIFTVAWHNSCDYVDPRAKNGKKLTNIFSYLLTDKMFVVLDIVFGCVRSESRVLLPFREVFEVL